MEEPVVDVPVTEVVTEVVPVVELPVTEVVPVVEVPVTEVIPVVEVSNTIISLDDLLLGHDLIVQKEATDKLIVDGIATPNTSEMTSNLYQWAKGGFPPIFPLFSVGVDTPHKCADGVSRSFYDYVEYLLGGTIGDKMQVLQARLPGMQLSYSINPSNLVFHVSKA